MKFDNLKINKLNASHINSISKIWESSFPSNIKTLIGNKIIKIYLKKFLEKKKNLTTGIFKNNRLIGFVLFGEDKNIISEIIKGKKIEIVNFIFLKIFKFQFQVILKYVNIIIYLLISKFKKKIILKETELIAICVHFKWHKNGLGSFLINQSIKKYRLYFNKFNYIKVETLKNSQKNINFYNKNQFIRYEIIYNRISFRKSLKKI